jgi:hypothetical protein
MVYNINVEFQSKQSKEQSNKMVKTRNQNQQYQQSQQGSSEGLTTRSGLKLEQPAPEMERVELPAVKLSKEMKRQANVKKDIVKKSWKKQTDKTYKTDKTDKTYKTDKKSKQSKQFKRLERDFLKHVYHNAGEMTAIWKNFEMAFRHIDKLCLFQKRIERK